MLLRCLNMKQTDVMRLIAIGVFVLLPLGILVEISNVPARFSLQMHRGLVGRGEESGWELSLLPWPLLEREG